MYTLHRTSTSDKHRPYGDIIDEDGRKVGEIADQGSLDPSILPPIDLPGPGDDLSESQYLIPQPGDTRPIFICGRCDMVVGESDHRCEFCGAEFEEGASVGDASWHDPSARLLENSGAEGMVGPPLRHHQDLRSSPFYPCSAEKVDVLSMMGDACASQGAEHIGDPSPNSFLGYSRMLREIEEVMTEAGDFGAETDEARGKLLGAWKACHEGKWMIASQLTDESKRMLAASVGKVIQSDILCLREALIEMKRKGRSVTPFVIEMKTIQKAISELRLSDAMRLTKDVMAEVKAIQMRIINNTGTEPDSECKTLAFLGQGI